MPGDVDHVIDAAEDSEVAVRRLNRAVTGKVRPVPPVLALGILVVFLVIGFHEAVGIFPDGLHDAWPRVADADVAGPASWRHFVSHFIVDDRMNAGHSRS